MMMIFLASVGWSLFAVAAVAWVLSQKYVAREREIVAGLNQINARLERLERTQP